MSKLKKNITLADFELTLIREIYSTAIYQDQPLNLEDHQLVTNP
jgi:hypothetical protein